MRKPTEKEIETQILDWLNYQPGVFAFKVNTTGIFDPAKGIFRTIKSKHIHKGTADIIGVKNGKFFAIEVKTPARLKRNKDSHILEQANFLSTVNKAGGAGVFACSLDQVIPFIDTL